MERHGSESYFVVGEGLLGEAVGGRDGGDRRLFLAAAAADATPPFRFSRMGPSGVNKQLGEPNLKKIGQAMANGGGGAAQMPAGFTYLGQFVDHDLTFDKTDVMLGENVTPAQLEQGRSPSLDLDSMYGAGPNDPESEKFYEADKLHLKMGTTVAIGGIPAKPGHDLPRGAGATQAEKRKAIIPDPRNDENLAVAQLHLGDDPLPQPRGRHAARLDTARPALRQGAPEGRQALPVDAEDGLPPSHLRARRRQQRLQPGPEGVRGRRPRDGRADDADRVLGGRLQARPFDGAGDVQLEPDLRQRRGLARPALRLRGPQRRLPRKHEAPEQLDRRLPAPVRLLGEQQARSRRPAGQVQPRDAHRHDAGRPAQPPPGLPARGRQPRGAQPAPGADGEARDGTADGRVPPEQGRERHEVDERPDPGRERAG